MSYRAAFLTCAVALFASAAQAGTVSATAVSSASGHAPSSAAPFFDNDAAGGEDRVAAQAFITEAHGAFNGPTQGSQVLVNSQVLVFPGSVMTQGNIRLSDLGPGTVGNVVLDALGSTRDVVTLQGAPSQTGQVLRLNGKFVLTSTAFSASAQGQASAQFPGPPTDAGFADADSHLTWSLASAGLSHGSVTLAESHHGIDNERGLAFNLDHAAPAAIPFHLDLVVGRPTQLDFVSEIFGSFSLSDLTLSTFGRDGDNAIDLAHWNTTVRWVSDAAFVTDARTGAVMHGLNLGSASGFDWLGDGEGAAGIPEPQAWALMIAGFAGVGAALRRRRPVLAG